MVNYLEDHHLNDSQHDFQRNCSCLTYLHFFYNIINIYDKGKVADVINLDIQKAFNKVPHQRLPVKIKLHGSDEDVLWRIGNWLTGCKQREGINGQATEWLHVTSAVPQGSVLELVLFLIYISDINYGLHCKISNFDDDTKLGNESTDELKHLELQTDKHKLMIWAHKWQMNINIDKCKVLHTGCENKKASYSMNSVEMQNVNEEKDLGAIISGYLKPSK